MAKNRRLRMTRRTRAAVREQWRRSSSRQRDGNENRAMFFGSRSVDDPISDFKPRKILKYRNLRGHTRVSLNRNHFQVFRTRSAKRFRRSNPRGKRAHSRRIKIKHVRRNGAAGSPPRYAIFTRFRVYLFCESRTRHTSNPVNNRECGAPVKHTLLTADGRRRANFAGGS